MNLEDVVSDEFKSLRVYLSDNWQTLEKHLSKPLDDEGKKLILSFLVAQHNANEYPDNVYKKNTLLYHEIDNFKKKIQSLIPEYEEELIVESPSHLENTTPREDKKKLAKLFNALSLDAKINIIIQIMYMTRGFSWEQRYHPIQFDIAAKLALDSRPKPQKHQGRYKDIRKKNSYKNILKLWRELGETNLSATYNPTQDINHESPLVGFTFTLLKMLNTFTNRHSLALNTIRQDLSKYKKLIYLHD